MATLAVACALSAMSVLLAIRVGWIAAPSLFRATRFGAWLIAALFALRAVGDFRYVGFFKTVRDSRFAELDTRFYSPLCVLLAVSIAFAALSPAEKKRGGGRLNSAFKEKILGQPPMPGFDPKALSVSSVCDLCLLCVNVKFGSHVRSHNLLHGKP